MAKHTLSFRTEDSQRRRLDELARLQKRDRSFLINEALEQYLDLHSWQIAHIEAGLAEAERGEFASEDEVAAVFDKRRAR